MKSICGYKTDQDFYDMFRKVDQIKDATKESYIYSLKRITRITNKSLCESILDPIKTFAILQEGISSKPSLLTTIAAVLAVLKYTGEKVKNESLYDKWYATCAPLLQDQMKSRTSNEPTKRQLDAMVTWDEVKEMYMKLGKEAYASEDHLLISFYYLLKPRRQEDYHRIKVIQKAGDKVEGLDSYIDLTAKQPMIVVKKYKTSDSHKTWIKVLKPEHIKLIKASLKKTPREFLFIKDNGEPYTKANSFTQNSNRMLKKMFGKPVTVNTLRHSYSTFRDADRSLTLRDRLEDAKDMGHSLETHMAYVLKTTSKPKKKDEVKFILKKKGKTFVCTEVSK